MDNVFTLLLVSTFSMDFPHTLPGSDHHLPFAAFPRSREWLTAKIPGITTICGVG